MIQFHELRVGDIVLVDFGGQRSEGEVVGKSEGDHLLNVETAVQAFWYSPSDL